MTKRNPTIGGAPRQPKTRPPGSAVKMFPVTVDCPKCGGQSKEQAYAPGTYEVWVPCQSCDTLIYAYVIMGSNGHGSIETAVTS